ncbi:MAG: hypothetical protein KBF98_12730 [Rhodoferax sp.]|nr:hypothetical protein [Rhodoferax sp.]
MQNLDRRVSALEQATPTDDEITIIHRIVSPGHLDAEIDHIRDYDGNAWTRQPGESEAVFTNRATNETPPNKWGAKGLIASNLELHHANH